jgi:carbamoyltransferase
VTSILGISAYYHDSAAALVIDGEITAAAQEERFTRIKGDAAFPHAAVDFCLDRAGLTEHDVDHVVFYENPIVKFDRILSTQHLNVPHSLRNVLRTLPSWLTRKLWLRHEIASELGITASVHACDHHLSHAASAFYPSPFAEAAILTLDGVGEWSTATWGTGRGAHIELREQLRFPNSIGLLYSAFTYFTGFKINSGEYKLMGLAPYGVPKYRDLILTKLVHQKDDGSIILNQRYFDYVNGVTMTNRAFDDLFGGPPRQPESPITEREMDIAASVQAVLNELVMKIAAHVRQTSGMRNLTLAGGVALNVVTNGILLRSGLFDSIWIQPASGDAGGAIGAALWLWHAVLDGRRRPVHTDMMQGGFLGPDIAPDSADDDEILRRLGASWIALDDASLHRRIAESMAQGRVVAIARGRMEFGPRALGARSILGDARLPSMQSRMNQKIKFRESFRPFAPVVLAEKARDWFDLDVESPYMLLTAAVTGKRRRDVAAATLRGFDRLSVARSEIPAVTHVDDSARVQTVDATRNPFLHAVLAEFDRLTGCPVAVNTSFNVRGEPIVNTVEDAYRCFMATEIDDLVAGNRFLTREEQRNRPLNDAERQQWLQRFDLD